MADHKRLLIIAGGTGGHVFPGLAVAHYLQDRNWQIHWLGSTDRLDAELVPSTGIAMSSVTMTALRERKLTALCAILKTLYSATRRSYKIIKKFNPHVVLGMGSYLSVPGSIAARLAGIPLILHEQNCVLGLANRCLSPIAKRVLRGFYQPGIDSSDVVGNPLRKAICEIPEPRVRFAGRQGPLRLLVIGGSQGAQILNKIILQVAAYLGNKVIIWHQTGAQNADDVRTFYSNAGLQHHRVCAFIENIEDAYSWADRVVCRSGALTVSELAAVGLSAILIPFKHKDRQQYFNAQQLQRVGAATILQEDDLTVQHLVKQIQQYARPALLRQAECARACAMPDATQQLAHVVEVMAEEIDNLG